MQDPIRDATRAVRDASMPCDRSPAYESFERLLDTLLSVPHHAVERMVEDYRARAAANPRRPGPKRKQMGVHHDERPAEDSE